MISFSASAFRMCRPEARNEKNICVCLSRFVFAAPAVSLRSARVECDLRWCFVLEVSVFLGRAVQKRNMKVSFAFVFRASALAFPGARESNVICGSVSFFFEFYSRAVEKRETTVSFAFVFCVSTLVSPVVLSRKARVNIMFELCSVFIFRFFRLYGREARKKSGMCARVSGFLFVALAAPSNNTRIECFFR